MRFRPENKLHTNFSTSAMSGIVLLLLVFFLLSTSFLMRPGFGVQLSKNPSGGEYDSGAITVTVSDRGRITVNNEQVSQENLGRRLSDLLLANPSATVNLCADRDVTLENTVHIMDVARSAGATRFILRTLPPSPR